MEVGPDHALHDGRRARRSRHRREPPCPGCTPPAKRRRDCTARIASAAIRSPTCVVFGRRAGAARGGVREGARATSPQRLEAEIEAGEREMLAPFERDRGREPVRSALARFRNAWAQLVGIFRVRGGSRSRRSRSCEQLKARAATVRVEGSRMFNPGWHLARDLKNMLIVSEAITRAALLRKESRGAHSRLDFTAMDPALGKVNHCAKKTASRHERGADAAAADAGRARRRCSTRAAAR